MFDKIITRKIFCSDKIEVSRSLIFFLLTSTVFLAGAYSVAFYVLTAE